MRKKGQAVPQNSEPSPKKKAAAGGFGECFFGDDADFHGMLRTSGFVRIEGKFSGSIESGASVVIGEGSRVEADVSAQSVIISGKMKGKIDAVKEVQILPTAAVAAEITAGALIVERGGLVYGRFTRR